MFHAIVTSYYSSEEMIIILPVYFHMSIKRQSYKQQDYYHCDKTSSMKLILVLTIVAVLVITLSLAVSPLKERKDQDHTDEKSGFWLSILLSPHSYGVRDRADSMKKNFLGTKNDQRKLIEALLGSYLSVMEKQNAEGKGRRQSKSWVEGPPAPVMDASAGKKSWMEEPQGPPT